VSQHGQQLWKQVHDFSKESVDGTGGMTDFDIAFGIVFCTAPKATCLLSCLQMNITSFGMKLK